MSEVLLRQDIHAEPLWYQTLALAGCYQACALVHEIASGQVDDQKNNQRQVDRQLFIHSLLATDPANPTAAFVGLQPMAEAFRNLATGLSGQGFTQHKNRRRNFQLEYMSVVLQLRKLAEKKPQLLQELQNRIETLKKFVQFQAPEFLAQPLQPIDKSFMDNFESRCAEIYTDTFGQLSLRVIIQGTPEVLRKTMCVHQIRMLLLASIRCAFLWHQLGGRGWSLLFKRKKIISVCDHLAKRIESEHQRGII